MAISITVVRKNDRGIPSIEYIYPYVLCGGLNCGHFVVRDGIAKVIVVDLAEFAFSDKQTRLRFQCIDVLFELQKCDRCSDRYQVKMAVNSHALRSREGRRLQRSGSSRRLRRTCLVEHVGRTW